MRDLEHLQNERIRVEQASACEIQEKQSCQTNSRKAAQPDKLAPVVTIFPVKPDAAPEKRPPNGLNSPDPRDTSPEVKPA
jgi:hypothetical protein